MQVLEAIMSRFLLKFRIGNGFLTLIQNSEIRKENIDRFDDINMFKFA